jgi:signal transduction histidine kinase/ligand-binding sensor domain-containing protein
VEKCHSPRIDLALVEHIVVAIMCLVATGLADPSLAQSRVEQVDGFTHTVWSPRDGVPDGITSMAQTPDGWIWLASKNHLYRFDGVTAELVDVPAGDSSRLMTVFATSSGDLWLGYSSGRTLLLPAGDFQHPRTFRSINTGSANAFLQDKHGGMWLQTEHELYKADGMEWHPVGQESGLYGGFIFSIQMDSKGTIWLINNAGVFTLADGHTRFEQRHDLPGWLSQFTQHLHDPSTSTLSANRAGVYLRIDIATSGEKALPTYFESGYDAMTDASGGFWLFTRFDGVLHAASPNSGTLATLGASLSAAKEVDPAVWLMLSASPAVTAMEDRQHNIWVGTPSGLERFRPNVATALNLPRGDVFYTLLPGDNGTIWFGTAFSKRYRWWHVGASITPAEGYDLDTTAAYRDTDGSVLLGTGTGFLRRFIDGKFEPINPEPPGVEQDDDIIAIVRDVQQKLWISVRNHPIYQLNDGRWIANGGFVQLPKKGARRAITDARGRLWLGYDNAVFAIDGQRLTRYGREEGMDIANVREISTKGMVLVGGDDGLAAFDGRRFHRISTLDPPALTSVTGIVRLDDGTVWLNCGQGGVRIGSGELERALKDASYKVPLRVVGEDDGMPGTAQDVRPVPTIIEGTDGRLWFANTKGIAWLDPSKIALSHGDPTIVIRSIAVGDKSYPADSVPVLPTGTRNIQINYTVIGLSNAASARFRYELIGVDKDWQDAGNRRQAFYTNLAPGNYEFRVSSNNEDGAWVRAVARLYFSIKPEFYQTTWFLVLCIALTLMLLGLAYLYHLRQLTLRLHLRLEGRHAERDRIARELHDTYLQTVHGLVLKVHAVSHELPEGSARAKILGALELAKRALVEGRDRVYALRVGAVTDEDLAVAFNAVAQEYDDAKSPEFHLTSTGAVKTLSPMVKYELYASGREAIINAFAHSSAKTIRVDVRYDKKGVRVEVADDGKGIDPQVLQDGEAQGHWGLRGIRERIELVGGECHISSDAISGTKVVLFVVARRAYASHGSM